MSQLCVSFVSSKILQLHIVLVCMVFLLLLPFQLVNASDEQLHTQAQLHSSGDGTRSRHSLAAAPEASVQQKSTPIKSSPKPALSKSTTSILAAPDRAANIAKTTNIGKASKSADIFNTAYLFQVFGSLLLVFGCIFGLVFLVKKMNGIAPSQKSPVRIIGVTRVGSREKIVLLEAGNQQLLIGVCPNSIRTLHTFAEPVIDSTKTDQKTLDFSALLGSAFTSGKSS